MAISFTNNNSFITLDNSGDIILIRKNHVFIYSFEPFLAIQYNDYNNTNIENFWSTHYSAVTSPSVSNATQLQTILQGYIDNNISFTGGTISNVTVTGNSSFYILSATTLYSGSTNLNSVINTIASNYSASTQTFSAGTNLTLLTSSTNPNVVYSLRDGINLQYGITGGSFFQTSVNSNQFLGESYFDNDVHISSPNLLSAYDAQLTNIYNTALTSSNAFVDSLTANTILNYTATTDYLTVNNYFTTPTGYIDQFQSYQGGFQYDLSATTYYSGFTPLESIIYNIAANATVISAQTFSAGSNLILFTSSTTPNVTYQLATTLTDILALYSLNIYNYGDINNQGNIYNSGKVTTTEAEMINLSATTAIYSGANFTNLETIIQTIAGSYSSTSIDYAAQLATKANLSGASFTGQIKSGSTDLEYIFASSAITSTFNSQLATKANTSGNTSFSASSISASTYYSGSTLLQNYFPYDQSSFRLRGSSNDRWHTFTKFGFSFSSAALTNGRLYAFPLIVGENINIDRLGVSLSSTPTSAGTEVIRLGIYNSLPSTHYPGTLLLDAGTVPASAITNLVSVAINQSLTPGLYYLALQSNNTNTIRTIPTTAIDGTIGFGNNPVLGITAYMYSTNHTSFGVLPNNPFTATTNATTTAPAIFYRIN